VRLWLAPPHRCGHLRDVLPKCRGHLVERLANARRDRLGFLRVRDAENLAIRFVGCPKLGEKPWKSALAATNTNTAFPLPGPRPMTAGMGHRRRRRRRPRPVPRSRLSGFRAVRQGSSRQRRRRDT
jgi:hypothetical protein